jgi:hypothetical protein
MRVADLPQTMRLYRPHQARKHILSILRRPLLGEIGSGSFPGDRFWYEVETIAKSTPPLIRPSATFSPHAGRRRRAEGVSWTNLRVSFISGAASVTKSRPSHRLPAPHPAFGHLLPACGEKEKTSSASSQRGISAGQPHQERGRALHLGLQYRRPSMRRPISFDGYRCGYGGMLGCAALTPPCARWPVLRIRGASIRPRR